MTNEQIAEQLKDAEDLKTAYIQKMKDYAIKVTGLQDKIAKLKAAIVK